VEEWYLLDGKGELWSGFLGNLNRVLAKARIEKKDGEKVEASCSRGARDPTCDTRGGNPKHSG